MVFQAECASTGGAIFCLCPSPRDSLLPLFAAACDDGRVRIFKLTGLADQAAHAALDDPYAGLLPTAREEEELTLISTLPKTKSKETFRTFKYRAYILNFVYVLRSTKYVCSSAPFCLLVFA